MNDHVTSAPYAGLGFNDDPLISNTLPAAAYTSQEVFDFEMEHLFAKSWTFVGHKNDFAEAGDFIRKDIGKDSVIVVKDRDDEIRAFHNVCRHRAHKLIQEQRGKLGKLIRCPYHSWTYKLDGELIAHSVKADVRSFEASDNCLVPVRIEEIAGFIFINLDDNAPAMADWAPEWGERIQSLFKDIETPRAHSVKTYEIDANWKVIVDNGIDNYHFARSGPHHRSLARLCDFDNAELISDDVSMSIIAGPSEPVNGGYDYSVKPDFWQSENFIDDFLWPNFFVLTFPYTDIIFTFEVVPVSAEKSVVEMIYYCVNEELDAVSAEAIKYMNDDLGPEDVDLNVGVQEGLNSRAYNEGRFMVDTEMGKDGEQLIHHFHKMWLNAFDTDKRKHLFEML